MATVHGLLPDEAGMRRELDLRMSDLEHRFHVAVAERLGAS